MGEEKKKKTTFLVATNVVANRPPNRGPIGMLTSRTKMLGPKKFLVQRISLLDLFHLNLTCPDLISPIQNGLDLS